MMVNTRATLSLVQESNHPIPANVRGLTNRILGQERPGLAQRLLAGYTNLDITVGLLKGAVQSWKALIFWSPAEPGHVQDSMIAGLRAFTCCFVAKVLKVKFIYLPNEQRRTPLANCFAMLLCKLLVRLEARSCSIPRNSVL